MPLIVQYLNLFVFALTLVILFWSKSFKGEGRQLMFNIGMGFLGVWSILLGFFYAGYSAVQTIKSLVG